MNHSGKGHRDRIAVLLDHKGGYDTSLASTALANKGLHIGSFFGKRYGTGPFIERAIIIFAGRQPEQKNKKER